MTMTTTVAGTRRRRRCSKMQYCSKNSRMILIGSLSSSYLLLLLPSVVTVLISLLSSSSMEGWVDRRCVVLAFQHHHHPQQQHKSSRIPIYKLSSLSRSSSSLSLLKRPTVSFSFPRTSSSPSTIAAPTPPKQQHQSALAASSSREDEIRRKIRKLKQEGKIKRSGSSSSGGSSNNRQPSPDSMYENENNDNDDDNSYETYSSKVRKKLGKTKSQLLGFGASDDDGDDDEINRIQSELDKIQSELDQLDEEEEQQQQSSAGVSSPTTTKSSTILGSMGNNGLDDGNNGSTSTMTSSIQDVLSDDPTTCTSKQQQRIQIDPSIFDRQEDTTTSTPREPELTEEELVELVAKKLAEKRAMEDAAIEAAAKARREAAAAAAAQQTSDDGGGGGDFVAKDTVSSKGTTPTTTTMTTSGVGGSWVKNETAIQKDDMYKPKTGSWGAFPRPKDISKAYGGGRRVGAGFSKEDDAVASMNTQKLLKDYRRKVGIDVPSEKEHADQIDEALKIGQLAMQRGVYGTAVSALEKVTQWCSTNSKVGSKVYLELAMAYEAVGRTKEAYQIYKTLTECRMEDVKYNAKRLLYGMEAMEIMKDLSSDFSRTKTRNTFIDATGLDTIAQNFDDVYQTAYIDKEGSFYKRLTESVVRSPREARQILLKATGKGEVGRMRVVQALRCLARQFDDCLKSETTSAVQSEPTAYLNGKPIVKGSPAPDLGTLDPMVISIGDFVLLSPREMVENLAGKWRLQLLADKQGDGVSFFNTTTAVQDIRIEDMTFSASGPSGLVNVESSGDIDMEESKRVLTRPNIEVSNAGGGILSVFRGSRDFGFLGAISREQQVVSVDSVLLITKSAPGSRSGRNAEKDHFAVWRRIDAEVAP